MSANRLPATERLHPLSEDLDLASPREVVARLHEGDRAALAAVRRALPEVARLAEAAAGALRSGGRLVYVGAGTSGRLCALDAAELPPTFGTDPRQVVALVAGGPAALEGAIEAAEDRGDDGARGVRALKVGRRDLVIGVTASGATAFVLGALAQAKRAGADTALVCCNPDARVRRAARRVVALHTGPELVAGSTRLKAGTATKMVLNAVSTAAMVSLGKVYRGRMIDVSPTNRKLADRAKRMVAELAGVSPTRAQALLRRAGGRPRLALAMHFTGLGPSEAARRLESEGLRQLEARSGSRSGRAKSRPHRPASR